MASSTDTAIPRFFDTTPGVWSAIGLNNVLLGLMVAGIVGKSSVLVLVPLVNSTAVCLANGLSYYAYTAHYATLNQVVAAFFADLAWLVQEAGLPFYSYVVLDGILRGRERILFLSLFWVLMLVIFVLKAILMVYTVGSVLGSPAYSQAVDNHLALGYYLAITIVECMSAAFLLKKFYGVLRSTMSGPLGGGGLYRYLMRSTEIRLATMALIGITRTTAISVNLFGRKQGVNIDFDGFIYTIECLFPIVMYMDVLGSRLIFADESSKRCNNPNLHIVDTRGSDQPTP